MEFLVILLLAFLVIVLTLCGQCLVWRYTVYQGVPVLFLLSVAAMIIVSILVIVVWPGTLVDLPAVLAVSLCVSLAYVHWYVALFRSLSIRILDELQRTGGTLTLTELERLYPMEWMFRSRLQKLTENGWIRVEGERYLCTAKGKLVAGVVRSLRSVYGIEKAG